jgi:hypothetical protein
MLTSDGIWQQLIRNKYLGSISLSQVEWRQEDSHFWYDLMKVKRDFLRFDSFKVKDGSHVRFWEDVWLGSSTLRTQYLILYNIAKPKNISIAEVLCLSLPNLSWYTDHVGRKVTTWNELFSHIANLTLQNETDVFHWNLTRIGVFSVKSHYHALMDRNPLILIRNFGRLGHPSKLKIFPWYLSKGILLTKDNLARRNWICDTKWCLCHHEETIDNLFFDCRFARYVWSFFHCMLSIPKPSSATHMLRQWL